MPGRNLFTAHCIVLCAVVAIVGTLSAPTRGANLLTENFDELTLGPIVTIPTEVRNRQAWTPTPPMGWVVDNSAMPGTVIGDPNIGVKEYQGWTFVDRDWWVQSSGDQDRSLFLSAHGTVAVADSDEFDDYPGQGMPAPSSYGFYDAKLRTPSISLGASAPNTVNLFMHSSWREEGIQKATLTATYDDLSHTTSELLHWESDLNSPQFKADAINEALTVPLNNPAGASHVTLEFHLFDAKNNWFWAIDDLNVFTGAAPAADGVLRTIINRNTGNIQVVNQTGGTVNLRGYSITSAAGTLDENSATFLSATNPSWVKFSNPAANDLSEGHLSSAPFAQGGTINFGNVWRKYYVDSGDIDFQYLTAGSDTPVHGIVEFTGNGAKSFQFLDLNFNGQIDIGDWDTFRAGFATDLTGLNAVQKHQLGDVDGDGAHTLNDFLTFKQLYDTANGAGAFAAALAAEGVPEPKSAWLLASAAIVGVVGNAGRKRLARAGLWIFGGAMCLLMTANPASAQLTLYSENFDELPLGPNVDETLEGTHVWTNTAPTGWTIDNSGVPGYGDPVNHGQTEWSGWAFTNKDWWVQIAGDQGRAQFTRGSNAVMVADSDEWQDRTGTPRNALYNTFATTKTIAIPAGIPAGRLKIGFDSSWQHEAFGEIDITNPPDGYNDDNQSATLSVSYNGGPGNQLINWDSDDGTQPSASHPVVPVAPSPHYKPDAQNEAIVLDAGYNGTDTSLTLKFGYGNGYNDWWWAVDNLRVFVPADPSILKINTTTGQATLVGGDAVIQTPINSIDIKSTKGNLNPVGPVGLTAAHPDAVDGPDGDNIAGNSSGENWQQLAANHNRLAEAFLYGDSPFSTSRSIGMGSIFNPSTLASDRDVTFTYTNTFGDTINGVVQYFASPPVPGDYNNNGIVDAADYTVWRDHLGQTFALPNRDGTNSGPINQNDFAFWKNHFGAISGSGSATAVPEPSSDVMGLFALAAMGLVFAGHKLRSAEFSPNVGTMAKFTLLALAVSVNAPFGPAAYGTLPPSPFLDRNYRFGDSDAGPPVNGGVVGVTFDSAGSPGMNQLIDLTAFNSPHYVQLPTVAGGAIPVRPDGGTGLAIQLNPTSTSQRQYLKTGFNEALNMPERSPSSTFSPGGTINYSYIRDSGFELWVLPTTVGAAASHIVMDTNQHGALIDTSGHFAMRYAGVDYGSGVTAVANNWYHLSVVRPNGPDNDAIMYVNGVAVAAANGPYAGESNILQLETTPLVVGANTSTASLQVGFLNHFRGVVDDLKMFAIGFNSAADYGEFLVQRDDDYAAFFQPSNPVDLTGDNQITLADASVFASNWLYANTLHWTQQNIPKTLVVGDLTSRMKGDFNFDGVVNLKDWALLNDANPGVGAAAMALIQGNVPEPNTFCLAGIAAVAVAGFRRRRKSEILEIGNGRCNSLAQVSGELDTESSSP